jgi:hypothetical protein
LEKINIFDTDSDHLVFKKNLVPTLVRFRTCDLSFDQITCTKI